MNEIFKTFKPEGFTNLNSYLFAEEAELLITFLKNTFAAEEQNRVLRPDSGDIANCVIKIGDTCIMINQARGMFLGMRTSFYLYVSNVDFVYKKALENGGKSVFEAADMEFGDRQAGIEDPFGNYWWISQRLDKSNY